MTLVINSTVHLLFFGFSKLSQHRSFNWIGFFMCIFQITNLRKISQIGVYGQPFVFIYAFVQKTVYQFHHFTIEDTQYSVYSMEKYCTNNCFMADLLSISGPLYIACHIPYLSYIPFLKLTRSKTSMHLQYVYCSKKKPALWIVPWHHHTQGGWLMNL